ncbi:MULTISPECIES: amidase [unclassified Thiomonas]|uniref:amidase n=1 Tax=unclassified Thiomonas TaxID=2625466 RepID=UPI00257C95E0|nr:MULTISPECIES: amidase [unclassified Thiomonas]
MSSLLNETFAVGQHPVNELAAAIKARRLRVGEVVEFYLERIDRLDGKYRAFAYVDPQRCREEAAVLDGELERGVYRGPLTGIPLGVKDVYAVRGMPMRLGSGAVLGQREPTVENKLLAELRRCGAIILGKTNMTELSLGTVNLQRPTPWNPVDPAAPRTPGGSSSGSAVAVAAGLCPLALGTDTGGSVRQPAAMCGVVGYKSTYGRWPQSGVFPLSRSLDSLGFFTRSMSDMALVVNVLEDASEPVAAHPIAELTLAVPMQLCRDLDRGIERGFHALLEVLSASGAQVKFVDWPEVDALTPFFKWLVPRELLADLGHDAYAKNKSYLDPMTVRRIEDGLNAEAGEEQRLRDTLHRLQKDAEMKMRGFSAWLCPSVPHFPRRLDRLDSVDRGVEWNGLIARNARPVNVFAQCALSLPICLPGFKLPMGVQLSAAYGQDRELLAMARSLETLIAGMALPGTAG